MKGILVIQIVFLLILIFILIKLMKINKALKYNERLAKYTVNNEKINKLSFGDKLLNIYRNFNSHIVKALEKSSYFNKKAVKYEKYNYINNNSLELIATKITLALLFGLGYFVSSIIKYNFDFFFMLLFMVIGYFVYNIYLVINEHLRNKYIEEDLLKAIIIMNNAFKSGYNITQAINFVAKDLTGPISDEFKRIGNDLKYGLELKDVFDRFYIRVKIEDVKFMTSSLNLLNLTGGNLVGIFTSIEKSFTNKKRLRDELNAMTSSSKLVFYILLVMPIILISLLLILSPNYYSPLFQNPIGYLVILLAIILYASYIIIIRKILKVES